MLFLVSLCYHTGDTDENDIIINDEDCCFCCFLQNTQMRMTSLYLLKLIVLCALKDEDDVTVAEPSCFALLYI